MPRDFFWCLQRCCKCHEKLFGACNGVANAAKNFLVFATVLQVPRKTFWCLQRCCKCREKLSGACNSVANASKNFLAFATLLQTLSKSEPWGCVAKSVPARGEAIRPHEVSLFNRSEGAMRGHTRRNEAVTSGCARRVQIVVTTMVGVRVAMCSGDVHLRIPLLIRT